MIKTKILFDKNINGMSVKDLIKLLSDSEKSLIGEATSIVSVNLEDSVCQEDNIMRKSLVLKYRTKD